MEGLPIDIMLGKVQYMGLRSSFIVAIEFGFQFYQPTTILTIDFYRASNIFPCGFNLKSLCVSFKP